MYKILILITFLGASQISAAAIFNCEAGLSDSSSKVSFVVDTCKGEQVTTPIDDEKQAMCLSYAPPEGPVQLTCLIGNEQKFSSATVEVTSRFLFIISRELGQDYTLSCVNANAE